MANMTLKELARHAAHRTAPTEFSVASVDAAFADEMKKLTSSVNNFMRNRYDIYEIENPKGAKIIYTHDARATFDNIMQKEQFSK